MPKSHVSIDIGAKILLSNRFYMFLSMMFLMGLWVAPPLGVCASVGGGASTSVGVVLVLDAHNLNY